MEQKEYAEATLMWVHTVVIDLALCPFAAKSILDEKLSERVILTQDVEQILSELLLEVSILEENPNLESSLITVPLAPADFESYLDILDQANELLKMSGFEGVYQLASFHPKYQFAGTEIEAPENYTNRSPYPVFHIIREAALSEAIDNFPGIEEVPDKNIVKMNEMGLEKLQALLKNCNPHF